MRRPAEGDHRRASREKVLVRRKCVCVARNRPPRLPCPECNSLYAHGAVIARSSGTATEPVELRFALACVQLELLLGVDDVHDGVDQCQVRERLREVTELAAGGSVELLGVQSEWTRMGKQLLAESTRARQL